MLPLHPVLTARNHRKSAEKQKEHFTQEDYIAENPAAPALYLVFAYKEKTPGNHQQRNILLRQRNILLRDRNILLREKNILLRKNIFSDSRKSQYLQGFPGFSLPFEKS